MRKILVMALMGFGLVATDVQAQIKSQPQAATWVYATGEFGSSTTTSQWKASLLPLVSATVSVTAAAPDTIWEKVVPEYSRITFQARGTKTAGRTDSTWFFIQGCIDTGGYKVPTSYHTIDSIAFGNASTEQCLTIVVKGGAGNPYTHYRGLTVVRNQSASSAITVKYAMMVKWKETEGWEMDGADVWADDRRQKLLW